MKTKVPWKKSERFERVGSFELEAEPGRVFPLLCPVAEYDWLPGWSCTMRYSKSGLAEKDAVFTTRERMHRKAVWTTITHEPPRLVEYLIVGAEDLVVRLSIGLTELGRAGCRVEWRMLFTASPAMAKLHLADAFSEENFANLMTDRKRQLSQALAGAPPLPR